jgi:hypothetical protein
MTTLQLIVMFDLSTGDKIYYFDPVSQRSLRFPDPTMESIILDCLEDFSPNSSQQTKGSKDE